MKTQNFFLKSAACLTAALPLAVKPPPLNTPVGVFKFPAEAEACSIARAKEEDLTCF